ncbi:hypothetical protein AVEN_223728-1, partial [Araneus ventricosus]
IKVKSFRCCSREGNTKRRKQKTEGRGNLKRDQTLEYFGVVDPVTPKEDVPLRGLKPGRGKAEDSLYCAATLNIAPQTTAAAREHYLRAYLHVQHWSGFAKRPLDWCWKETKHGLFSVTTHKEPAAPVLLSMISLQERKSV